MPTYEFDCPECKEEFDIIISMKDYDNVVPGLECEECQVSLVRTFRTAPNFKIPSNCTYDGETKISGGSRKGRGESRVPINIIDYNPDGSAKVTRIGKRGTLDNE